MVWTTDATRALLGKNTDKSFSALVSITHTDITGGALHICLNEEGQDIISSGVRYSAYPFEIEVASDLETAPVAKISVANVSRKIGETLRQLREAAQVSFKVILIDNPDNILTEYFGFYLRHVSMDALVVEGELVQAVVASEPYPFIRVIPLRFPSLFQ
ncbi:MAG: hypothetical protein AB7L09_21200 [Nitrospira sp.]